MAKVTSKVTRKPLKCSHGAFSVSGALWHLSLRECTVMPSLLLKSGVAQTTIDAALAERKPGRATMSVQERADAALARIRAARGAVAAAPAAAEDVVIVDGVAYRKA